MVGEGALYRSQRTEKASVSQAVSDPLQAAEVGVHGTARKDCGTPRT